jgi:polygalacturonase
VARPTENITISNCTMADGHGGVVIGSEMSGGVRNITIANCVFDGTERGIRIKSSRGRGGVVEDVLVSNIIMRHLRREAVVLTTFYEKSNSEPVSERTPIIRNIHFSGISGDAKSAGELTGLSEMPLEGVSFSDIHLETSTGMTISDSKDISFHQVEIATEKGPSLLVDRTSGLEIDGLKTAKVHDSSPVIDLRDVKRSFVHGCASPVTVSEFIRIAGPSAAEVFLEANHFSLSKTPVATNSEAK